MPLIRIHDDPTEFAKEALLDISNGITLNHVITTQWSTWHLWDYLDRAHLIQREIQAAISEDEDLSSNFNETDIALIATKESATSDYDHHVIAAIIFPSFCIVSDTSLHSSALVIYLGQTVQCEERMLFSGRSGRGLYRYYQDANGKNILESGSTSNSQWKQLGYEIDPVAAIQDLAIPGAREWSPHGTGVPVSKLVALRSLFNYKPVRYHSIPVGDKHLVTACQIKVDFANRRIQMQIPLEDWLSRAENQEFKNRVLQDTLIMLEYSVENPAAMELRLELGSTKDNDLGPQTRKYIVLMSEFGEKLGLPKSDFLGMAKGVYRAWSRVDESVEVPENWPEV
ncbi:hypothetical protein K491DRAFT_713711 [Lophiostoma macrostomum CBS 122681]|uniref:Uncharacterized protein n=1 Tax=Lophiostoma macrostomum CBS 122681 TaxID=1314788 RepID=A0A6A6TI50_9PLEO|nr:hypothetical protein K491DRAFT_713711 [Lophiostoma macrostomum CBS 122681]